MRAMVGFRHCGATDININLWHSVAKGSFFVHALSESAIPERSHHQSQTFLLPLRRGWLCWAFAQAILVISPAPSMLMTKGSNKDTCICFVQTAEREREVESAPLAASSPATHVELRAILLIRSYTFSILLLWTYGCSGGEIAEV